MGKVSRRPKGGTCCTCGFTGKEETPCPERNIKKFNFDQTHCEHWWDGEEEDNG